MEVLLSKSRENSHPRRSRSHLFSLISSLSAGNKTYVPLLLEREGLCSCLQHSQFFFPFVASFSSCFFLGFFSSRLTRFSVLLFPLEMRGREEEERVYSRWTCQNLFFSSLSSYSSFSYCSGGWVYRHCLPLQMLEESR